MVQFNDYCIQFNDYDYGVEGKAPLSHITLNFDIVLWSKNEE